VSRGVCDGVRGKPDMSVDGFDFDSIHANKLEKLFEVIKTFSNNINHENNNIQTL
jgi:hypothetical protein